MVDSVYGMMMDLQTALRMSLNTTANRCWTNSWFSIGYLENSCLNERFRCEDTYGGADALGLDMSTARICKHLCSTYDTVRIKHNT